METIDAQRKKCPFCGEKILVEAIKCRFCGEFLNKAQNGQAALADPGEIPNPMYSAAVDTETHFEGSPSLAALAGSFVITAIALGVAVAVGVHLKNDYGWQMGLAVGAIALLWLLVRIIILKSTFYRVTSDRIELEEGVFNKDTNNVDLHRIVDLSLRRSLWDRIVGIGTIELITTDATQPRCAICKIRGAQRLYDILKKATLTADRRRGVIHVE